MTTVELARVVAEMRAAQREYFRTRSESALKASKRAEAKADRCLDRVLSGQRELLGENND